MTASTPRVLALVDELVPVLDEEITLLTLRRSQLEALSAALVARDEESTEALLQEIEQTQAFQADTDRQLEASRNALAAALGCATGGLRLSALAEQLPEPVRAAVDRRRKKIALLVEAFRRQHLRTTLQLVECMRLNRMLLEGLFGPGQSVTVYDMHGTASRLAGGGLVDAER